MRCKVCQCRTVALFFDKADDGRCADCYRARKPIPDPEPYLD